MNKPRTIDGYSVYNRAEIESTCLYVATKIGDYIDDVVVVGGLVPSLLVDQPDSTPGFEIHAGTMDLDVGLSMAIFADERYVDFKERLEDAGFEPDENELGNTTNQRWRTKFMPRTTIDFLISASGPDARGGDLRHIQAGFAAVINECLHLAFEDRRKVRMSGLTPMGEHATRDIWVCGPAAFTVLKTVAFRNRGSNKDAYDLTYVWRHLGLDEVVAFLKPRVVDECVVTAMETIRDDFTEFDGIGPRRAAEFLYDGPDEELQADIRGLALDLVERLGFD